MLHYNVVPKLSVDLSHLTSSICPSKLDWDLDTKTSSKNSTWGPEHGNANNRKLCTFCVNVVHPTIIKESRGKKNNRPPSTVLNWKVPPFSVRLTVLGSIWYLTRYTDKKRIHDIIAMVVAVISDFDDLIWSIGKSTTKIIMWCCKALHQTESSRFHFVTAGRPATCSAHAPAHPHGTVLRRFL
jgi:hypothetical protein